MTRHQWLLIVAIVGGLVGMHHLVQAPRAHMTSLAMASATQAEHADRDRAGLKPLEVRSTSTLVVASRPDCCDSMDMAGGYCCLAVLTAAIAALAAALIMAAAQRRPLEPGYLLAAVSAVAARPPPIGCAGLAQLCVLRR